MQTIPLALIQMHSTTDRPSNWARAESFIREAAQGGARLVVLPELFGTEYFCQTEDPQHFEKTESIPGPMTDYFGSLARELQIVLVITVYELDGYRRFNTAVVFDEEGDILGKYRKRHIPDDLKNYYGEAYYFAPGDLGTPVFETSVGKIGVLICWDQWFPEAARTLARQGAEVILYPTAIGQPAHNTRELAQSECEAWQLIQRSHGIANGVFIGVCNRVGPDQSLDFWGHSFVSDPLGRVLGECNGEQEHVLHVTLDRQLIEQVREDWPLLQNVRESY